MCEGKDLSSFLTNLYRFFIPRDIELRKRRLELMLWAFVLSLAFYPGWWGVLAWIGLARPLMIISRLRGRDCFNAGYFFGFFFTLFTIYWVALVTPPGMIAAVTIVAFYYAFILLAFSKLYRMRPLLGAVAVPFLWVGLEYFRTLSEFAFPWSGLGYTQAYFLYILQIVSVISVHGLSLLIVTVNVLVWQALRSDVRPERRLTAVYFSVGIVGALVAYGWVEMPVYPKPGKYEVAVLQGSVPIDIKWELENEGYSIKLYDSLAQTVKDSSVKLYIWPESGAPCYMDRPYSCREMTAAAVRRTAGYHLIGALGTGMKDGEERYYNSCYEFDPTGRVVGRYDKVKLVPFSEHVPYESIFPFLKTDVLTKYLTFIRTFNVQWWSDFAVGDSLHLFSLPDATYGVLICFESTFPSYVRQMVRDGAQFMVGITNDTWFGNSIGIYMHSRIFVTRAVENRCWAARAANSGLSYIVDPYGRIRESVPHDAVTAFVGKLDFLEQYSVFTKIGDIAGVFSYYVTVSLLCILLGLWIGQRLSARKHVS
ncbi:apolipoprotein N-acyltransferase [candidate division GN15 bacterium]|uniref:Apolipoprotein N-acyltransferase n=1 Tax=candidate division GN15 bacterium TaxID=2072418 RepID=A0A855XB10_9BACT|nr:MAG: apolipoprotein N-acyltransferase [candidate division GN15 bacterium]